VFLKVYRGLPYFRGDARLSTWIFRIVANVCTQARSRRTAEVPGLIPVRERGSPDAAFADFELRERLDKAIAQLPENYRLLIAAHYLDGVQYDALAEALDVPIGTVKTHLYRAKRRLRELLQ
jgi:RNA polymerase sigma-70 factor (ECF subfamily)